MIKSKKGFVLMETIIVISVLCILLVVLYAAFSKLLLDVKKKSLYDNSEYIYKTSVIRKYFEEDQKDLLDSILENLRRDSVNIYCSDTIDGVDACISSSLKGHEIFQFMDVKGVYFTKWNVEEFDIEIFEPTTQRYLKTFDVMEIDDAYRIIVMFQDENDETEKLFQYATLRIGSRG